MSPPSHAAVAVMDCGISRPVGVNETPRGKAEPSARKDKEASETNKPRERGIPRLTAGSEASRPTLDAYRCNGGSRKLRRHAGDDALSRHLRGRPSAMTQALVWAARHGGVVGPAWPPGSRLKLLALQATHRSLTESIVIVVFHSAIRSASIAFLLRGGSRVGVSSSPSARSVCRRRT